MVRSKSGGGKPVEGKVGCMSVYPITCEFQKHPQPPTAVGLGNYEPATVCLRMFKIGFLLPSNTPGQNLGDIKDLGNTVGTRCDTWHSGDGSQKVLTTGTD